MKCYLVDGKGIDALTLSERSSPKIQNDNDVLIDVHACSLNYRDLMVAKGVAQYAPGTHGPIVALSDMAGVIRAVGPAVTEFKPNDRVLNAPFKRWPAGKLRANWANTFVGGLGVDGVLAEQVVYPADALVKMPSHLSFAEASTFPIAGLTAWAAVVTHGKTRPGEWMLLHGTGGVSVFAAQISRILGARTVMTTSSKEKADRAKQQLGVHSTVNYRDADWISQVEKITGGVGIDVIVDVVGGDTLARSLSLCNYGARVAVVGVLSGQDCTIKVRDLLRHQVQLRGTFMESAEELRSLMHAVQAASLKPIVDRVFPFTQVKDAYRYLESQQHMGKVVIQVV